MKLFHFLTLPLLFLASLTTMGQQTTHASNHAKLIKKIDSILQSQVNTDKIPGAVLQVKREGVLIYTRAYGYAQKYNYDHQLLNPADSMTTDCLFDIASLTKVIGTTTCIMLLSDRGLLNVDDPVSKYLPGFDTQEKKGITLRHLLTHTAGLYEWYPLYYRCSKKEEVYKLIPELPLKYPIGGQRKYSDLGFVLLGEIIERVSGLSLQKFMETEIFGPLGMHQTTYNPLKNGHFIHIAATSHGNPYEYRMVHDSSLGFVFREIDPGSWNGWRKYTLKGEVNDGNAWYANEGVSGAAGLFSTIGDLQILVDMLLNKGMASSRQFIKKSTIDAFLSPDSFKNGLGWMMDPGNSFMKNAPAGSFGHTGFTGTSIVAVPEHKISVILLINRQNIGLLKSGEYYNVSPVRQQVFEAVMEEFKHQ